MTDPQKPKQQSNNRPKDRYIANAIRGARIERNDYPARAPVDGTFDVNSPSADPDMVELKVKLFKAGFFKNYLEDINEFVEGEQAGVARDQTKISNYHLLDSIGNAVERLITDTFLPPNYILDSKNPASLKTLTNALTRYEALGLVEFDAPTWESKLKGLQPNPDTGRSSPPLLPENYRLNLADEQSYRQFFEALRKSPEYMKKNTLDLSSFTIPVRQVVEYNSNKGDTVIATYDKKSQKYITPEGKEYDLQKANDAFKNSDEAMSERFFGGKESHALYKLQQAILEATGRDIGATYTRYTLKDGENRPIPNLKYNEQATGGFKGENERKRLKEDLKAIADIVHDESWGDEEFNHLNVRDVIDNLRKALAPADPTKDKQQEEQRLQRADRLRQALDRTR